MKISQIFRRPKVYISQPPTLFSWFSVFMVGMLLIPIVYLVLRASQAEWAGIQEIILRPKNALLLWNTLTLTVGVVIISSLIALPLAYIVSRSQLKGRTFWVLLNVLPLAIPAYIGTYTYIAACGPSGLIAGLTGIAWPTPSGYWGAVGMLSLFLYPYLFLNFWNALRGLNPSLEEAARSLGSHHRRTWWRIILPMLQPAWLSGSLLIALHVFGDFGVVSMVRFETFSYAIYQQYAAAFDRVYAAWLSLMLLACTVGTLYLDAKVLKRLKLNPNSGATARTPHYKALGIWLWPSYIGMGLVALATLGLPISSMVFWLLQHPWPWADWLRSCAQTLEVALPTALFTTALAIIPAYLGVYFPTRWNRLAERSAYLGYATPPLALALALVFFSLQVWPAIYQTLPLLVFGYILHFLAEALGPIRTGFYQASYKLEEAARSLGYTRYRAIGRVLLPLLKRGMWISSCLVFLGVLKELPLGFLLSPTGFDTLAKNVWSYASESMMAEAAPYALTIVLFSSLLSVLLFRQESRLS